MAGLIRCSTRNPISNLLRGSSALRPVPVARIQCSQNGALGKFSVIERRCPRRPWLCSRSENQKNWLVGDRYGSNRRQLQLIEGLNYSNGAHRHQYRPQSSPRAWYGVDGELRQSVERRIRTDGAPEVSEPQANAARGVVDSSGLEDHLYQWPVKADARAHKAGSSHDGRT